MPIRKFLVERMDHLLPSLVRKHLYPQCTVGGVQAVARLFTPVETNGVRAHGWPSLPCDDGKAIDRRAIKKPAQSKREQLKGE